MAFLRVVQRRRHLQHAIHRRLAAFRYDVHGTGDCELFADLGCGRTATWPPIFRDSANGRGPFRKAN